VWYVAAIAARQEGRAPGDLVGLRAHICGSSRLGIAQQRL